MHNQIRMFLYKNIKNRMIPIPIRPIRKRQENPNKLSTLPENSGLNMLTTQRRNQRERINLGRQRRLIKGQGKLSWSSLVL